MYVSVNWVTIESFFDLSTVRCQTVTTNVDLMWIGFPGTSEYETNSTMIFNLRNAREISFAKWQPFSSGCNPVHPAGQIIQHAVTLTPRSFQQTLIFKNSVQFNHNKWYCGCWYCFRYQDDDDDISLTFNTTSCQLYITVTVIRLGRSAIILLAYDPLRILWPLVSLLKNIACVVYHATSMPYIWRMQCMQVNQGLPGFDKNLRCFL